MTVDGEILPPEKIVDKALSDNEKKLKKNFKEVQKQQLASCKKLEETILRMDSVHDLMNDREEEDAIGQVENETQVKDKNQCKNCQTLQAGSYHEFPIFFSLIIKLIIE